MSRSTSRAITAVIAPLLFSACSPRPASIELVGEVPNTLFTGRSIPVPKVLVKDAEGRPLDPQPNVTVKVGPADVLAIFGTEVTTIGDGEGTLSAELTDPPLRTSRAIRTRVVERTVIECVPACDVEVGQKVYPQAVMFARGERVPEVCDFGVSGRAFRALPDGSFEAVEAGTSVLNCPHARVELTASLPVDALKLTCPPELVDEGRKDAGFSCVAADDTPIELALEARARGGPTRPKNVRWTSSDVHVVSVKDGRLFAQGVGTAKVTATVGALDASLELRVRPATKLTCDHKGSIYRLAYRMELDHYYALMSALICESAKSEACVNANFGPKVRYSRERARELIAGCCCMVDDNPSAEAGRAYR